jgi:hypothetical protein
MPPAVEDVGHVARPALDVRRGAAEVVDAEDEVGADDAVDGTELVPDPQCRQRRVVAAGGLAADDDRAVRALELRSGDGQAVVATRGERVLRREPVVDRDDPHAVRHSRRGVGDVVQPWAAHDHRPAVEVQVRPDRGAGVEHAARDSGDRLVPPRGRLLLQRSKPRALLEPFPRPARSGIRDDGPDSVEPGDRGGHLPRLGTQPLVLLRPEHVRIVRPAGGAVVGSRSDEDPITRDWKWLRSGSPARSCR